MRHGGKGKRFGTTWDEGGRGEGHPHFVNSFLRGGAIIPDSPFCRFVWPTGYGVRPIPRFVHSLFQGAYYSRLTPFHPFVPPSLPVGASFLAPPFRFLRVPRVVSGTFLRLELVKNCQNGKIFPFLVRRCTSLFRSECSKRCTFRDVYMVVIGFRYR